MNDFRQLIDRLAPYRDQIELFEHEPMAAHTTMQIGGAADIFLNITENTPIETIIRIIREENVPLFVIGRGSNLLVQDQGVRGVVLCTKGRAGIRIEGSRLFVQSGASLFQVAKQAQQAGLTGMEFAAGIPGSVGGGIFMNAGAYGGSLSDIVRRSVYLDTETGETGTLTGEDHAFGYRASVYKQHPTWMIVEAELELTAGDPGRIQQTMDELAEKRREKQPLSFPSAGSTFKRPAGFFAGKLIEDAGLRGCTVGGAQVSEKHAGFLINRGNATCADMLRLIETVQQTVKEKFGVTLECEVRVL